LDNVQDGVNFMIAQKLGLHRLKILQPKQGNLMKLEVYVPQTHMDIVRSALFEAGAGHIGNYSECSYTSLGEGTFKAEKDANPFVGEMGSRHTQSEAKLEVVLPQWMLASVLRKVNEAHPYEEVAYQAISLKNSWGNVGSGMVGELEVPMNTSDFLSLVKERFGLKVLKHTPLCKNVISKVAICGGSGSFLTQDAKYSGADIYISSDFKYHEFFDAEGEIILADIGHFESEQYTIELLSDWLAEKFPTFAVRKTRIVTNPINYF
jgi:hypothetical protein